MKNTYNPKELLNVKYCLPLKISQLKVETTEKDRKKKDRNQGQSHN